MMIGYTRVVLIGFGKIAFDCLKIVKNNFKGKIDFVKYENEFFEINTINSIKYHNLKTKNEVTNFFKNIDEECLVISCNNNYLFTNEIINKKNLFLINFHNALLPLNKGRNAQTWSIFNEDEITGVTWHKIVEKVDNGDILVQKKVDLIGIEKAINLTRTLMNLGAETFSHIFPKILNNTITFTESLVKTDKANIIHFSKDIPNNGFIDLAWSIDKIYAFLRSIDYGILNTFPKAKINLFGSVNKVFKYEMSEINSEARQIILDDNFIIIIDRKKKLSLYINERSNNKNIK